MNLILVSLTAAILLLFANQPSAIAGVSEGDPSTVAHVDLDRYLGTWYEIASYPQVFSRGCTGTRAIYAKSDDGNISVTNQCRIGSLDGQQISVTGVARSVDPSNAKLKVRFPGPGEEGDYWIIDLGEDYDYAVVSGPGKQTLWILSRKPSLQVGILTNVLERIEAQGFDLDRLEWTLQRAD